MVQPKIFIHQLFKGTFYHCDGPMIENVRNKSDCLAAHPNNVWINQVYNFDNFAEALITLFVVANKDGWLEIMYAGLDAVGVDQQVLKSSNRLFW